MLRSSLALVGVAVGAGCGPAPRDLVVCGPWDPADLHLTAFDEDLVPGRDPATLPVWVPPQGGLVAGLNVVARGVPRSADWMAVTLFPRDGAKPMGELLVPAALFLCQDGERAMFDQAMVPFPPSVATTPDALADVDVRVDVRASFPRPGGGASVVLRHVAEVTLVPLHADTGAP